MTTAYDKACDQIIEEFKSEDAAIRVAYAETLVDREGNPVERTDEERTEDRTRSSQALRDAADRCDRRITEAAQTLQ